MDDNAPPAPDAPGMEEDRSGPSPQVIAALLGGGSLHEGGVHGSVLKQSVEFAEEYMKPDIGEGVDPTSGKKLPVIVSKDGVQVMQPSAFEAWADRPRFRKGTAALYDLTSFIGHVNRYKDADTIVFADNNREHPSLTAVLDYHKAVS